MGRGTRVRLDQRVVETDLLVSTGIVEPHQYAGFSGGWKTVAIGTAASGTISRLHGMRFLEDPSVRLASTTGNVFLEELRWIGERAGLRFVVNVSLSSENAIEEIRAGHPEAVHGELSKVVRQEAVVAVDKAWPIVIGGAGHPKDSNLYQATRMPTYLCFGRKPVVAPRGVILIPAACPEGAGSGPGEKLFFDWLSSGTPDEILTRARRDGYPAGGQRAVMVAWARQIADIAFIGTACPDVVEACGMKAFPSIQLGVDWARETTGKNEVLVVPHCLTTLPELSP
jgi:lactate racemase